MIHLFEIVSVETLPLCGDQRPCAVAADGCSLFFPQQGRPVVAHWGSGPELVGEYGTARVYTGLCHDPKDGGFWACVDKKGGTVYRLTDDFREVDRIRCHSYSDCYGLLKGISYDRQCDCLVLTYSHKILCVEKGSLAPQALEPFRCSPSYQCCVRSCGREYTVTKPCYTDEILSVSQDGQLLVHACLPLGHRVLGMTETREEGLPVITLLTARHGTYYALLKGILIAQGDPDCPCAQEAPLPRPGKGERPPCCRDSNEMGETHCHDLHWPVDRDRRHRRRRRDACRHSHPRQGPCHDIDHGHLDIDIDVSGSCASVMESIALEQTAISHILNAEGEKIQKVVAVSDRPADFLEVNHSVNDLVTRLLHLEQVLFSKLELACETLRRDEARDTRESGESD